MEIGASEGTRYQKLANFGSKIDNDTKHKV